MADEHTPTGLPTITGDTPVKTTAGVLWTVVSSLIGAASVLTLIYTDVRSVKAQGEENAMEIKDISRQLSDLRLRLAESGLVSSRANQPGKSP